MQSFLKPNVHSVDIDCYDVHSIHYALTCEDVNAGYLRIVLPKEELTQNSVIDLGLKYDVFNDYQSYLNGGVAPFPFLNYKEVPANYWSFYKNTTLRKEMLLEASRLVLHPDFRTIRTSKFLIECAIAYYVLIYNGIKHAIVSCFADHAAFYQHYGFKEIDQCNGYKFSGGNATSLFLSLSLSSIPTPNHARFREMADEFRSRGKIEREF